jgi:hypothetical protein
MSEATDTSQSMDATPAGTPKHLWVIGLVALLWNAYGAMDYVMTQTRNESYLSAFTPEQLDFFFSFPAWLVALWAIAVWGGLLGSIVLLMRKRLAVPVFLVSVIAMATTSIYNYVFSNGMEIMGDAFSIVFTAVIFLVALGLWWYARSMADRGVLA